jgi:hypothetical protein
VLLKKLIVAQLPKKLFALCGTVGSLPCSQEPITGLRPEGEDSSGHDHSHLLLRFVRPVRKIAKSDSLLHVCLSVLMEQLGSHWTDFHEI